MKMQECKRNKIYDVGFIDPNVVSEHVFHQHPDDVEADLYTYLTDHNYYKEIIFPYNLTSSECFCLVHILFSYSMLTVTDQLCMSAYVNVRRFH